MKKENGLENQNEEAWMFDLSFKLDRLNNNLERQIKIWSWWAVISRGILNAFGYLIGLVVVAALLAFVAGRYLDRSFLDQLLNSSVLDI